MVDSNGQFVTFPADLVEESGFDGDEIEEDGIEGAGIEEDRVEEGGIENPLDIDKDVARIYESDEEYEKHLTEITGISVTNLNRFDHLYIRQLIPTKKRKHNCNIK